MVGCQEEEEDEDVAPARCMEADDASEGEKGQVEGKKQRSCLQAQVQSGEVDVGQRPYQQHQVENRQRLLVRHASREFEAGAANARCCEALITLEGACSCRSCHDRIGERSAASAVDIDVATLMGWMG